MDICFAGVAVRLLVPQRIGPARGECHFCIGTSPAWFIPPSTRKSNVAGLGKWGHVDQVLFGPFIMSCRQPREQNRDIFPPANYRDGTLNCQSEILEFVISVAITLNRERDEFPVQSHSFRGEKGQWVRLEMQG